MNFSYQAYKEQREKGSADAARASGGQEELLSLVMLLRAIMFMCAHSGRDVDAALKMRGRVMSLCF